MRSDPTRTSGLGREQGRAAALGTGPVRVVAGAGTGKTAVIAERFRRLVAAGSAPASILVMTFTDRAAAEMRRRALDRSAGGLPHRHRRGPLDPGPRAHVGAGRCSADRRGAAGRPGRARAPHARADEAG